MIEIESKKERERERKREKERERGRKRERARKRASERERVRANAIVTKVKNFLCSNQTLIALRQNSTVVHYVRSLSDPIVSTQCQEKNGKYSALCGIRTSLE